MQDKHTKPEFRIRKSPVKRAIVIYTHQPQLRAIKAERNVLPKVPTIRSTWVTPHSCEWIKEDIETMRWTITALFLVKILSERKAEGALIWICSQCLCLWVSWQSLSCPALLLWLDFWYLCFLFLFLCLFPLCHSSFSVPTLNTFSHPLMPLPNW